VAAAPNTEEKTGRLWAVMATLAAAVFFGGNAVASKMLYAPDPIPRFDAVGLIVARGAWMFPLFLALALLTRPHHPAPPRGKDVGLFVACGVAFGPGACALAALGASATSAAHAVLLLSLFPPLAAGLAALLLRERLAPIRLLALVLGVLGAATLTLSKTGGGATTTGDLLVGAFILSWALLTLGVRKLNRTYPPLFVVGVFGTLGSALLALLGVPLGRLDAVLVPLRHFDLRTVLCFDVEMVLLLSLGGQLLQGLALRTLNVALVAALTSYGSIFAGLAASFLFLGERLTTGDLVAGAFLVTAVALSLVPENLLQRRAGALGQPSAPPEGEGQRGLPPR
jgi:drug/metabolite transporter (DMT)-like permease